MQRQERRSHRIDGGQRVGPRLLLHRRQRTELVECPELRRRRSLLLPVGSAQKMLPCTPARLSRIEALQELVSVVKNG